MSWGFRPYTMPKKEEEKYKLPVLAIKGENIYWFNSIYQCGKLLDIEYDTIFEILEKKENSKGILLSSYKGYHFKYARYDDKKIYKTACDLVRERNTR